MGEAEVVNENIARGLATKGSSFEITITACEFVFHVVREFKGMFPHVREIDNTQRDKSMDIVLEVLLEEQSLQPTRL